MKCDWVRQNILFYVYNELEDDARYEVEQHLARCPECAGELKAARNFHTAMSQNPVTEPTPNLLAASRMRLQEALETTAQGGFLRRLIFEPTTWLRQVRMAPAMAAVIFIVGFGGGIGATYNFMANRLSGNGTGVALVDSNAAQAPVDASAITGIRSVTQEPGSNQVSIKYDTISTQEAQGSLNDQRIQQLLLFAARNNFNSGVRMDSVDVLTQTPNDSRVREVLMYSLQNDTNPGVRMKALDGLSGLGAAGSAGAGCGVAGSGQRRDSRGAFAGIAAGGTDEGGQQGARGVDPGIESGSECFDPLAGADDAGADAGVGLGETVVGRREKHRRRMNGGRRIANGELPTIDD